MSGIMFLAVDVLELWPRLLCPLSSVVRSSSSVKTLRLLRELDDIVLKSCVNEEPGSTSYRA